MQIFYFLALNTSSIPKVFCWDFLKILNHNPYIFDNRSSFYSNTVRVLCTLEFSNFGYRVNLCPTALYQGTGNILSTFKAITPINGNLKNHESQMSSLENRPENWSKTARNTSKSWQVTLYVLMSRLNHRDFLYVRCLGDLLTFNGTLHSCVQLRDSNKGVATAQDISWFFCEYIPQHF